MKFLKYILIINLLVILGQEQIKACGPYYPDAPRHILMFRCCTPQLERQWQEGCRFQDYEREQNCLLWQNITSASIPVGDIGKVIYDAGLADLIDFPSENLSDNKFAQWLADPQHIEDLEYVRVAKEIEELRAYMNNPWYYAYDGDQEHVRLAELKKQCQTYSGNRHASRYALQLARLYFAGKEFNECITLWENSVCRMPQDIVTDMIASYVGGAYSRNGNRDAAIELFTRSQDIGSLISLKAWNGIEQTSGYNDKRVKELEYILNRFPDSPLLSVKLQEYIRSIEWDVYFSENKGYRKFFDELKRFTHKTATSKKCRQQGLWNYASGYLHYLDGDNDKAISSLKRAERADLSPYMQESIHAFRILMDAERSGNSKSYRKQLLSDLTWLDERLANDVKLTIEDDWQYNNKMNWKVSYWQDVVRKVLLGTVCPKMLRAGDCTLALQLANYATNRIYQIVPQYGVYHYGDDDSDESYTAILTMDEYRKESDEKNWYDYSSQFFEMINSLPASQAARYVTRITQPVSELDRFLNERSYIDSDYLCDIVGTLYMREMDYVKADQWLSKVSSGYQKRTNLAKEGYFRLDPFRYQFDKKQFIADSTDYKLRFAREMVNLEKIIRSDSEPNRKADAKIRFATGLRNSFGRCWYLTDYGFEIGYDSGARNRWLYSIDRELFKKNPYAQRAYKRVDLLMRQAISEFTDPERAAQAQLAMMNYATLMKNYPDTKAAEYIRSRCDNYRDYALQHR